MLSLFSSVTTSKESRLSKPLWSGKRPDNQHDAESRICEAAFACFGRLGIAKTTMSDIARSAGIARPTLYKYFKNKTDVVFRAIDQEAYVFAKSVVARAREFPTIEDRIVETIVYVVAEFPRTPNLAWVLGDEMGEVLRARAFSDEATLVFSQMTAQPLLEIRPDLADHGVEITEIMSRFAISMILFPGRYSTDLDGLRDLIKRRMLPGLLN
jgi:AcrR family transcriptional regulator